MHEGAVSPLIDSKGPHPQPQRCEHKDKFRTNLQVSYRLASFVQTCKFVRNLIFFINERL